MDNRTQAVDCSADTTNTSSEEWLCLRPGASVLESSSERLLIAFANYTVTFSSPPVTKGIHALLSLLQGNRTRVEAIRLGSEMTGLDPEFIGYLIDLLLTNNCLYKRSLPAVQLTEQNALVEFFAYLGQDPALTIAACRAHKLLVVIPSSANEDFAQLIDAAGLVADLLVVRPGTSCRVALAQIEDLAGSSSSMLICWNFPYRLPFARLLNDLAIKIKTPILFGACEGVVGRIGPYVIPGNTACLECCNSRLLAHAGGAELQAFTAYRVKYEDVIPSPCPTHPLFHDAVVRLFAIELSLILTKNPPRTIGGFIEHRFFDSAVSRHTVHKVPRCPGCSSPRPQRFAWDARFAAPTVKNSAE